MVTGAAGFIGSNLSEYLLEAGHIVIGVDNFNDYYNPKIKEYNIKSFSEHPNFILCKTDILDLESLEKIFSDTKPEAIIHLAAWAGVTRSIEEPVAYVRNNVEGTVNLAELCIKHGTNNFIFASTSSIYGDNPTPFREDMSTDHPLAPYPATKKACEVMLSTYNRNFGLNVSILRIFNPLGPRVRPDLAMTKLVRSCVYGDVFPQYQDAENTGRDYTYIKHMFEAIDVILNAPLPYEIFNLGNSSPVTLKELISTVEKVIGKKANIQLMPTRQGEMTLTYANIEKAGNMLNYKPTTSIEEAIGIYYKWFQSQEDWYKKGNY